jgi:murein DD-endopeptidase MepM/ murein hydrolase activator NlpD
MLVRRALAVCALACAAMAFGAGPASAVPETTRAARAQQDPLQVALERRVHERELALTAMFDAAERHAEVEGVRADRLAALGYSGNLPELEYVLPIHDYHLSAGFGLTGPHWETIHTGLDFGASTGTDLVAVADGTVTEVAYAGAYGIRTILTLQDGTEVWYCHQLTPLVFEGQTIEIGEPLGLVGSTGNSTGPHLHLEVRPEGGSPIDPVAWLQAAGLDP